MTRMLTIGLTILSLAAPAAQKDLARERVTLQFKDTPVTQVFPALAKSLGYELTLDPKLRALVTLQVVNVTAQTALDAICQSIGCSWQRSGNRLVVNALRDEIMIWGDNAVGEQIRRSGGDPLHSVVRNLDDRLPFDITWSPIDLQYAVTHLARMANAAADVAPSLQGRKIAVVLTNATLRQALDEVCRVGSCQWELQERPKRVVRVFDRSAAGDARRIFDVKEPGLTGPRPVYQEKPYFTPNAMRAGIRGTVTLACVVETDGTVGDVEIVKPLNAELDQEAVKAAKRWRFTPGMKDGHAVRVRVEIEMSFSVA